MDESIEIRPLASVQDAKDAAALIDRVWGEERIVTPALLRALGAHGNPVIGAWRGVEMVGTQMGFVGITEEGPILHSHITGVAPGLEHRGVGFALKLAQREWCLAHGVGVVTWTFDPMIARNAYFNLVKLGALGVGFHRDYYGEMADTINIGERSDRLEVRWELRTQRVVRALEGAPSPAPDRHGRVILQEQEGRPVRSDPGWGDEGHVIVGVPSDYLGLREGDRDLARAWRDAVAGVLEEAFERGYRATGFVRSQILNGYVLDRDIAPLVA
jgi:predicted GNAT superfamily acetyltransferase